MAQKKLNNVVIGVLNDFMGFLTTRKETLILSSHNLAAPAAVAIEEFLVSRNIANAEPLFQWEEQCQREEQAPLKLEKEPISLTANQINRLDEVQMDIRSTEATLKIAMTFASNRFNELNKAKNKWWNEMAAIHNLDLKSVTYEVDSTNGTICIKPKIH